MFNELLLTMKQWLLIPVNTLFVKETVNTLHFLLPIKVIANFVKKGELNYGRL